jgi:hypothetical protein
LCGFNRCKALEVTIHPPMARQYTRGRFKKQ